MDSIVPVTLLFLRIASADPMATMEDTFVDELRLAVDDCAIREVALPPEGFVSSSMAEKMVLIRRQQGGDGVTATLWLEASPPDRTALNLVALSEGRALVKVVEAGTGGDAAAELALAARELLAEAALFRTPPETESDNPPPPPEPPPPPAVDEGQHFRIHSGPGARIGGGIDTAAGPSVKAGGLLFVEFERVPFFVRLHAGADAGPFGTVRGVAISGWDVTVGLDAGYLFIIRRIALAPFVGATGVFSCAILESTAGARQRFYDGTLNGSIGLEFRVKLGKRVWLFVNGRAGLNVRNQKLVRSPDEAVILVTPRVDWQSVAGIRAGF